MDSDFALGMLKTISTFLDFFATIKFLKKQLQTLQLLNFWISRQNLIRLHNDLRSIFFWLHYWLRGYVGVWLAFRPGDWGSNLTWAKKIFPYIDNNFQIIYILAKPEWPNRLIIEFCTLIIIFWLRALARSLRK